MAKSAWSGVLRFVRARAGLPQAGAHSDATLLQHFAQAQDEAALVTLLQRHGPLVLATCRQVLPDDHAAEDAFQATFLVLARKAGMLHLDGSLAPWLHRVAYRAALNVKTAAARRQAYEEMAMAKTDDTDVPAPADWWPVLHEEVNRLPERYRRPLVLCYLQGRSYPEAAAELDWPEGTVGSRLHRARALLHQRLVRRGVTLAAGLLPVAGSDAGAAVPPRLLEAAARAAVDFAAGGAVPPTLAAVAEGLLQETFRGRLEILLALALLLGVIGTSASAVLFQAADSQRADPEEQAGAPPPEARRPRTDACGDPLPEGALFRIGTVRLRHGDQVQGLAFHPGGTMLVSMAHGELVLWDRAAGNAIRRWSLDNHCAAFAVSPDGKRLASVAGGKLSVWEIASGKHLAELGHEEGQRAPEHLAFTPDGKALVAVRGADVIQWDVASRREVRRWSDGQNADRRRCALSGDCRYLALTRDEAKGSVELWDVASGKKRHQWQAHDERVLAFAFAPDNRFLATLGNDRTIRVWDPNTTQEVGRVRIPVPYSQVLANLTFSPDGRALAGDLASGTLWLWDWQKGTVLRRWTSKAGPCCFSPDGRVIAAVGAGNAIRLWEVDAGNEEISVPSRVGAVSGLAFAPDGRWLISRGEDGTRVWEATTGRALHQFPVGDTLHFSPDRKAVALARHFWKGGNELDWPKNTGEPACTVRILRAATGQEITRWEFKAGYAEELLGWSRDGTLLLTHSVNWNENDMQGQLIRLWDVARAEVVRSYQAHSLCCSADLQTLAIRDKAAGTLRLVEAASGRMLTELPECGDALKWRAGRGRITTTYEPVFSPAGDLLVTAGTDANQLVVWQIATGKRLAHIAMDRYHPLGWFGAPSNLFTPDGQGLVVEDPKGHVCLLDAHTGKLARRLQMPGENESDDKETHVTKLAMTADARVLALAFPEDGTVRVWEVLTEKEFARFTIDGAQLRGISRSGSDFAFSPDGSVLATLLLDGTVLAWDVAGRSSPARDGEQLWNDLASADVSRARRAVWQLAAAGSTSVAWLAQRLRPVGPPDPTQVKQLINQLDSQQFVVRQRAVSELEQLEVIQDALQQALAGRPSLEMRQRIEQLLQRLQEPAAIPGRLQALRAVEVLEHIATPEARQLLEKLAQGADGARLTREAKTALERLAKRPAAR